jgi:hypothetical protein
VPLHNTRRVRKGRSRGHRCKELPPRFPPAVQQQARRLAAANAAAAAQCRRLRMAQQRHRQQQRPLGEGDCLGFARAALLRMCVQLLSSAGTLIATELWYTFAGVHRHGFGKHYVLEHCWERPVLKQSAECRVHAPQCLMEHSKSLRKLYLQQGCGPIGKCLPQRHARRSR